MLQVGKLILNSIHSYNPHRDNASDRLDFDVLSMSFPLKPRLNTKVIFVEPHLGQLNFFPGE